MNPRLHINAPLAWSAVSLLAILVIVLASVPALARAALGSGLSEEGVGDVFARLMEEHAESSATYRDRFNGRSVFFKPRPPRTPPVRVERKPPPVPTKTAPPPPPPPPSRPPYSGPNVGGIIGNSVFFRGDLRVSVGDTQDGMTVVSVDPPWSVKVEHRGWEYDLPLFERGTDRFFESDGDSPERNVTLRGFVTENADNNPDETARDDDEEDATPAPVPAESPRAGSAAARKKPRERRRTTPE